MNPVTLTPEQALAAMNTLTAAEQLLLRLATGDLANTIRGEIIELRRDIARQYNAPRPPSLGERITGVK